MRMYDILQKKKEGKELTKEEIRYFINGYTDGSIPDFYASAFTMAVCFSGMTDKETACLTDAMAYSGDTVDLSCFGSLSCDKHSTGGVGDKTSLVVAPIVACSGAKITKMSGRGLGHTGGTVDKLESIPGYRTELQTSEFIGQVDKVGLAVIGQSGNLTPADKKLYALRDLTATVDSIPLIVSSIMSKKIAAGSKNIVLDVKVGSGAFMKTEQQAHMLAEKMVDIGKRCGRNVAAVLTDMDTPLGCAVGNSLEVKEAINVLKGKQNDELTEVCLVLAAQIISLVFSVGFSDAFEKAKEILESGAAFQKMKEWISAQGGDEKYIDDPALFEEADIQYDVLSPVDGYIDTMDAEKIGKVSVILGAGRSEPGEKIDHSAGIIIQKKKGDCVAQGDILCTLHTNRKEKIKESEKMYIDALGFSQTKPEKKKLIIDIIK